jgi:hypothetical protein
MKVLAVTRIIALISLISTLNTSDVKFTMKKTTFTVLAISTIAVNSYTTVGLISSKDFHRIGARFCNLSMISGNNKYTVNTLYDVNYSGWGSPQWNWGSAVGTGHDCAKICRKNYSTHMLRQALVTNLLTAQGTEGDIPTNFEEVKLTLALVWQRGRWDGSDGGKGGYGEVLHNLVLANRYEGTNEIEWSKLWIEDLASRFHLLKPSSDQINSKECLMDSVRLCTNSLDIFDQTIYRARRQCSGLVLQASGFIENGC